ncbi:MAG: glycosyl hydrolase family 18 protein [Bacteroidota bacterium]|nr:glycosyl hydrolase family 18 protein [Bacteroidota bacterium]
MSIPSSFRVLLFWLSSMVLVSCASLEGPVGPIAEEEETVSVDSIDTDPASEDSPPYQWHRREAAQVHGYYVWWTRGLWMELDLAVYDKLFFFSITPASDGTILERNGWPYAWEAFRAEAERVAVPVIPVIALLDADTLQALFTDAPSRDQLVETSLELLRESGSKGLNLDYEWFAPADSSLREGFHAYVDSLASRVEQEYPSAELSIFVSGLQPEGMIDVSRIPDAFSEIMVQGYDMHWQTGPTAGPVAPIRGWPGNDWVSIADSMHAQGLDASRIVMTVPYYGYEWPVQDENPGSTTTGEARVVTFAPVDSLNVPEIQIAALDGAREHGLQRDPSSGSPFYAFQDSTGWRQGWIEDSESLEEKYRFVLDSGMRGVAIFPIGYDRALMDPLLVSRFGRREVAR